MIVQMRCSERFQFTHPRRGATVLIMDDIYKDAVSIHAPQEGCDGWTSSARAGRVVSIHAPQEGCDYIGLLLLGEPIVSIHAPQEGCDRT